ncbi:glutamine-rich protein 2-like isoform X1 [Acanthaster planci]|uniref:Glutamine-rich protein 2-like isoform X1 n=1 Tax=Acanthaster planci TaxID=133434 RepID=A0A8B7YA10_ACAPL|nr:glutamine-rich protein 2-like isoform X1 [Acanthaster planci]
MSGSVSLLELVDLSLGTPEIVNYKGLRTLLIAIVENLKLGDVQAELKEADRAELLAAAEAAAASAGRPGSSDIGKKDLERSKSDLNRVHSAASSSKEIQDLDSKVSRLESQIEALNSLPSNENLMQRARSTEGMKPMSEMWQLMQLQKKASANEDGVSKLMSMVEDLLGEMSALKEHVDGFSSEIANLKDRLSKISANEDRINERLLKLENSTANKDRMDELQKIMNDLNNRMNTLPPLDILVTWPAMEDALKGIHRDPVPVYDHAMQTIAMTETTQVQTVPTTSSYSQTRTPSPGPRSNPPSRPGSAAHPSMEIQRILKDIGELKGRHDSLDNRVKILEELMNGKVDLDEVKKLLAEKKDVPEDLTRMLEELKEGLDSLKEGRDKMDQLDSWIREQSKMVPASQQDIQQLKAELANIQANLTTDTGTMAEDLPVGSAVSAARLDSMHSQFQDQLEGHTRGLTQELAKQLSKVSSRLGHLEWRLDSQGKQLEAQASMRMVVSGDSLHVEKTEGLGGGSLDLDGEIMTNMQKLILQLQAETDKLNHTCVQLVDEHNSKQKHIDALYTFVDRLQENKADKEHVIMEIDVKADKRALENKVSNTHFQGTVDELSRNLNDVMDKLSGHRSAWEEAVSEMKLDIDNKLDRMELDPLKTYLDNRIKSVGAKIVRKVEPDPTQDDAAGFRKKLLQKFNCISCDRPLDMTPQPPLASLPESKGLPGTRTGRPYTTFELEQIRAAQKKARPGKNVLHYENALQEQELARQRKQDILAYLVHFHRDLDRSAFFRNVAPLHLQPDKQSGNVEVPDYFLTNRSCGGSHTMTYPHRRTTRMANLTGIVREEDDNLNNFINGRIEADIQGQDGHIYKGRIGPDDLERLPTIAPQKLSSARLSRPGSSRQDNRRDNELSKSTPERQVSRPTSGRPQSRLQTQRSTSTRPQSGRSMASPPPPPNPTEAGPRPSTPSNTIEVTGGQESNKSVVAEYQPVEAQ